MSCATSDVFNGTLDNIKLICEFLKSISFDETALFEITKVGLRVTVLKGRLIQASVYINQECFSQYKLLFEVKFGVDLKVITEFLSIFSGVCCTLDIIYRNDDKPLNLTFKSDDEWTTECLVKTRIYEEPIDYNVDEENSTSNYIYFRGREFADLLDDIGRNVEKILISFDSEPLFQIISVGQVQTVSTFAIGKKSDMVNRYSCKNPSKHYYRYAHIKLMFKALALSTQVAIKSDENGLLEFNFMGQNGQDKIFAQFFMPALVDYD